MIAIEEMGKANGPGWSAEVELRGNRGALFQLWAPRRADRWSNRDRPHWCAGWDTYEVDDPTAEHPLLVEGAGDSDFRQGASMEDVLAVFDTHPDPDLATRARRLLTGAAKAFAGQEQT